MSQSKHILSNKDKNSNNNYYDSSAIQISGTRYFMDIFTNLSTIPSTFGVPFCFRGEQTWGSTEAEQGVRFCTGALTQQLAILFLLYRAFPVFTTLSNKGKHISVFRILYLVLCSFLRALLAILLETA